MPGGMYELMKNRYKDAGESHGKQATVKPEEQLQQMDMSLVAAAIQNELTSGWFNEAESANLDEVQVDPDHSGLQGIINWLTTTGGDDKSSFVKNFVETMPERAQLLSAYLVENEVKIEDLQSDNTKLEKVMSDLNTYTPNRDKFVDKMTASKFKFWKYVAGSQIYWEKYSKAARFARRAVELEGVQAQQLGSAPADSQATASQLQTALQQSDAASEAASGSSAASETGSQPQASQQAAEGEASGSTGVSSAARQPVRPSQSGIRDAVHGDPSKSTTANKINLGLTLGSVGGIIASTAVGTGGKTIGGWAGASEDVINSTQVAGNSVSAVGSILGAAGSTLSAVQGIADLAEGGYTASEKTTKALDVLGNTAGAARGAALATSAIAKGIDPSAMAAIADGSALSAAGTAVQSASYAAAGIGIGMGAFNLASGGIGLAAHIKHAKSINKDLEEYKKRDNVSAQEKNVFEQISQAALVSEKMAAVNSGFKAVGGAAQIAGGIITVSTGVTGVGALVGTIIAGVGSAMGLIGKIVNAIAFRGRKKEAIDRFINLKKLVVKLRAKDTTKDMKLDEDKVRLSFIQSLGYVSVDEMYDDLMWEFAKIIHENAVENDNPDYQKLLGNIGLKVDKDKKTPVPAKIARKLKG